MERDHLSHCPRLRCTFGAVPNVAFGIRRERGRRLDRTSRVDESQSSTPHPSLFPSSGRREGFEPRGDGSRVPIHGESREGISIAGRARTVGRRAAQDVARSMEEVGLYLVVDESSQSSFVMSPRREWQNARRCKSCFIYFLIVLCLALPPLPEFLERSSHDGAKSECVLVKDNSVYMSMAFILGRPAASGFDLPSIPTPCGVVNAVLC